MTEQIRREVQRGLAGMRGAMRSVLQSLALNLRVQRASAEVLAGEQLQDVELMQQFGFTSAPPAGTQMILLPLGGRTSASVIVATEHGSYRLQLGNQGEVAIYNLWGDHVWLKQDRTMDVVAGLKVAITSPLVTMSGNLTVAGNITSAANIMAAGNVADAGGVKTMAGMRTVYNGHTHTDPQGGAVGTPSGGM